MSNVYTPWPDRPPKEFAGLSKLVADAVVWLYRPLARIVRRFPGVIFCSAVLGACAAAWGITLLFQIADVASEAVVADQIVTTQEATGLSATSKPAAALGFSAPAWLLWPLQSLLVRDLIALTGIVSFVSVLAMAAIWGERKVSGHIQSRLGPMRVGGWHGWSQSIADGLKLLSKEDLIPDQADRPLFRLAPYLAFVPSLLAFVALPFGAYWVFRKLDIALLFILAMLGIEVMGVLIAGWASNNKWSVYGAMREACQVVSYEIPMGMSLLIPIMVAGSLQLNEVAAQQAGGWFNWIAWHSPWTFIAMFTYFIASLASVKRAPFDLPEAESELVAGFHTEYSGFRWSLFFFGEYAAMFVVSGLLVILFLGAWHSPFAGLAPDSVLYSETWSAQLIRGLFFSGPIWFILKCALLIYVQMWLRWTLPRLRIDQVLYSCVQVILPLTMAVLLASTFWELWVHGGSNAALTVSTVTRLGLGLLGAAGTIAILMVMTSAFRLRRVLVGPQAVERPLPGG